jgi:hypothetical protein
MWVGEECVQLKLANPVTLRFEEFDDCVEARGPIDLDGGGHLSAGEIGNEICTSASLRVVSETCAVRRCDSGQSAVELSVVRHGFSPL